MFWDLIGYSVVIFSIGGTIALLLIAVALLNLADAKMKWVELRRDILKNKFKRSVTKNKGQESENNNRTRRPN